ncbi:beta strand repeat-containing protein, partial [Desulfovibrio litoralis]
MKKHDKCLFKTVVCCLGVGLISLSPILKLESAKAETINYNGTTPALKPAPTWFGTETDALFPGTKDNPSASGNTVNVNFTTGSGTNPSYVFGGLSEKNSVYNNTVNIIAGTIENSVYGGYSKSGDAYANTVNISGGTITYFVFGGYVYSGTGNAYTNTVNISDGTIEYNVYGGYSGSGNAYANTVNISGGEVDGDVYGGNSGFGDAYANTVNISGTAVIGGDVLGGYSMNGDAYGNTVNISGDALIKKDVLGGWSVFGDAYGNTVNISAGTIGSSPGTGYVYGGYSYSGDAYGNTVNISGNAEIKGYVYGGFSDSGDAYGNTVNISGGTINGDVSGGVSYSGDAINNHVKLSGTPIFTGSTWLIGGSSWSSTTDTFTGNTLWVLNHMTSPVNTILSFQNYRFLLPNTPSTEPMLTATDIDLIDFIDSNSIAKVDRLGIASGGTMPNIGDKYTLLEATSGINGAFDPYNVVATKGISLLYDMNVAGDNDWSSITATVASNARVNPQTKALAEGIVSGVAFINQGADLAAGQGMGSALSSANAAGAGNLSSFGAMSAGSSRYNTGSHSDVDSFSLMTGLGWNAPIAQNSLLLGAFFEVGFGNYDSHNSFSGRAS